MIEHHGGPGNGGGRITIPCNPTSGLVAQAWLDFSIDGTGHLDVWYQKKGEGIAESHYDIKSGLDLFQEQNGVPAGTMMITYHVVGATGPWSLLVELKAK